jgi:hypothetical protein
MPLRKAAWRVSLMGILIFKGLTARRLYKSFDVKGLRYYTLDNFLHKIKNNYRSSNIFFL